MFRRQPSSEAAAADAAASPAPAPAELASPAVMAGAFARAASGPTHGGCGGGGGGGGNGAKGTGGIGGRQEERYYLEDGSGKNQGAAVAALAEDEVCACARVL